MANDMWVGAQGFLGLKNFNTGGTINNLGGGVTSYSQRENAVAGTAMNFATMGEGGALVRANRAAGNAFRDELANLLQMAGRETKTEVYKWTPFGGRFIDIEVKLNGEVIGGIETKVGQSPYGPLQRLKDWWLTNFRDYPVNLVRKPPNW